MDIQVKSIFLKNKPIKARLTHEKPKRARGSDFARNALKIKMQKLASEPLPTKAYRGFQII